MRGHRLNSLDSSFTVQVEVEDCGRGIYDGEPIGTTFKIFYLKCEALWDKK